MFNLRLSSSVLLVSLATVATAPAQASITGDTVTGSFVGSLLDITEDFVVSDPLPPTNFGGGLGVSNDVGGGLVELLETSLGDGSLTVSYQLSAVVGSESPFDRDHPGFALDFTGLDWIDMPGTITSFDLVDLVEVQGTSVLGNSFGPDSLRVTLDPGSYTEAEGIEFTATYRFEAMHVPEPGTVGLIGLGVLLVTARRAKARSGDLPSRSAK